jgi:hypothetical protein
MDKQAIYDDYRSGNLTEAEACEAFGDEWEDVLQLERVETILVSQPAPDTDPDDLFLD